MILDRRSLAGTSGFAINDEASLWASTHCIRPRYLAPPADIALRADDIYGPDLKVRRLAADPGMNHVLWAACKDSQYSADADVGGKPGGAFTYFFCRHIRDTAGKVTRGDLVKLVRASLKHEGFAQVPQLECPEDRRKGGIFS